MTALSPSSSAFRRRTGVPQPLLVAMALASAGPAWAQSAVSIYGIIDQGVVKANSGTTPGSLLPGRGAPPGQWIVKAGNTSRLGLRGQEDLGQGAYARFQVEHRFAANTGQSSSASVFWLGRSVVAIGSKSLGEIYAGREYSPAYWVALNADPTLWSYVSQLGSPYTYANYTPVAATIEASNIRWANSVGYKSPVLNGLSLELSTALGQGVRKRAVAGNVQYKQGPVWAGVGFDRLDSATNLVLVAGGYDFSLLQARVSYARAQGGLNGDGKSFSIGATVPASFGRFLVSYGRLEPDTGNDSSMLGAGAQYDLSKRTLLYTNVGSAKRDGLTRTTAFDLGVKHTF